MTALKLKLTLEDIDHALSKTVAPYIEGAKLDGNDWVIGMTESKRLISIKSTSLEHVEHITDIRLADSVTMKRYVRGTTGALPLKSGVFNRRQVNLDAELLARTITDLKIAYGEIVHALSRAPAPRNDERASAVRDYVARLWTEVNLQGREKMKVRFGEKSNGALDIAHIHLNKF